eukprot:6348825-Prymnesium_polylepis.1
MRAGAGEAAWDVMLRASVGDLERSTEALRRVYAALKAHTRRGLPGPAGCPRRRWRSSSGQSPRHG